MINLIISNYYNKQVPLISMKYMQKQTVIWQENGTMGKYRAKCLSKY